MKKIFTYFGIFLSVVLMGALSSCTMQELDPGSDVGLGIKVFSPTKVVTGQPMTINGTGLGDVKEIVFPDGVSVTNFEVVSKEMIRVIAPQGISAEGGKLILRTEKEQVESRLPMTLGSTDVSGFSKQPGEEVNGGEQITIFGKDLEFINAVELLDADGNTNLISHNDFYRKGTNNVIFNVPEKNIYDGTFVGKVYTYDGKSFDMPEWTYKPKQGGGHWEVIKTKLWENTDGEPIPGWGGKFRFCLEGHDYNNECIAEFPAEQWAIIKDGTFRIALDVNENSNIRITNGHWSNTYGGTEHNCMDMVQEDADGTKYIEINIKEEGNLYDSIDEKHLLFTGSDYTLLYIYTQEEIWVEDPDGHWEIISFWKNDGTAGSTSWNLTSPYRFCAEGRETGEQIAAIPADVWGKMKTEPFRITIRPEADWYQVRIIDAWWSMAIGGGSAQDGHNDITPGSEQLIPNEDGTFYIEINLKDDPLASVIDEKHLLFAGDGYTLLEIYTQVWVEGGEVDSEIDLKDFITYEQPDPAFSYPYYPSWSENTGKLRIKRDNGLKDLGLQAGKSKFIFYKTLASTGQLQINNPNWTALTTVADWNGEFETLEYVLDEDAIKCITGETSDGWSETAIILQGDGLEITKMIVLP